MHSQHKSESDGMQLIPAARSARMHRCISQRWAILCVAATIFGCTRTELPVNTNVAELRQYVRLSTPPTASRFELATLPENNTGIGVPGPTDYVALVAAIKLPRSGASLIESQPRSSESTPVPEAFLRAWLSAPEKDALRRVSTQASVAYNISALATGPAKRAIAIPVSAEDWVLYLEYVAP